MRKDFYNKIKTPYAIAMFKRKELKSSIKGLKRSLKADLSELDDRKKSIKVVEYIIDKNYEKIVTMFESAITSGLVDLFDEGYKFRFDIGRRGDYTTCDFIVDTGNGEGFLNVKHNEGTALAEIVATIFQLIIVKLDKTMPDFVLLDEPFGGLENDRQVIAGNFLKNICKELGLQLLVITQSPAFAEEMGNVHKVKKNGRKNKSVAIQV